MGGVGIAEAVHMNGLDAHAGTAIATMAGADAVAGVFLAMAPFVEGVVLATHGGKSNVNLVGNMKIGVGFFVVFLHVFRSTVGAWVSSGSTWISLVVKMVGWFCGWSRGMRNRKPR